MTTTVPYADFIARRLEHARKPGVTVDPQTLHASLKPFQRDVVVWAASVGCPAVWADTGLGKTRMQVAWCQIMADTSLIVAPLAVAEQTVAEAAAVDVLVRYVRSADEVDGPGVYITNYEMTERFPASLFGAVALDEASILKQSDGKTRTRLIEQFAPWSSGRRGRRHRRRTTPRS
jgi:hypothetical protein